MNSLIDFTYCRRVPGKAYNGANGKKIAIEYNGNIYMLKFPPATTNKITALSYSNSCFSEHIASSIFNIIGLTAHETMLGTFNINGKEKIVCACKDFTSEYITLFDFCSIKNTVIDSESNGTGTELSDIMETIDKQQFIEPSKLRKHFWDMFIVDAFLGNFDRHNGNWGFLYNSKTKRTTIAPVYDCGSCLLPQADEITMKAVIENESELSARVYEFPNSAIKIEGKKVNYFNYISSLINEDCNDALLRIVPRINMNIIAFFIENVPHLTDKQKEFYLTYINARYEKILLPAYDKLMGFEENISDGPTLSW